MTVSKTRALLAALMLASSAFAITAVHAQDREVADTDGSRFPKAKPAAKAAAPASLSSDVSKPLNEVIADINGKKWPEALAAANKAKAAAKTDYEKMKVNQFLTIVLLNSNDNPGATAAAEAAADTPIESIPAEDRMQIFRNSTTLALNAKHNDKALAYAKELAAVPVTDPAQQAIVQDLLGKAMYAANDPGTAAFFQKQIDATTIVGKAPTRDQLQMLMAAQIKLKDEEGAEKTMVLSVLYFNDKNDWKQIIDVTMSTRGIRDVDAVMLGRLLYVCGADVSKDDAQLIGETTQKLALYGDAVASQAKGATLQLDQARVNADKNSLPQQISTGASQNGLYNIKLAEALYGYGMYAEAETAARLAQTKGGADVSEVSMTLGMAQAMQGKYADAVATFATVKGGSPATPRIAELWTAYAKNKGNLVVTAK